MITTKPDMTIEQLKQWEKDWGNFNSAPPGFKEISSEEFAQSDFFTSSVRNIEFRQICDLPGEECVLAVNLFFFDSRPGFGMANDYWAKKVRYFTFAKCFHEYKELSFDECKEKKITHFGNCYHVYCCVKCGMINEVDSSG